MANTTTRRVLATRADGSQTVEEVKGAAGKGAADKKAILNSLRAQVWWATDDSCCACGRARGSFHTVHMIRSWIVSYI